MKILQLAALLLFSCVSSFAQNKIGIVNTDAFYDEKTGIKMLTEAVKLTYDCDFQTLGFIKKIDELKNEISNLKDQGKFSDEKVLELSKLEEEYNLNRKRREESYKKRVPILLQPIEKRIKGKLKVFEKGYSKIIELSDDKVMEAILYVNESFDVTNEFIKFCNEEFEKEKLKNKSVER